MLRQIRLIAPALAILLSAPLWAEELEEHVQKSEVPESIRKDYRDTSLCNSVNFTPRNLHDNK